MNPKGSSNRPPFPDQEDAGKYAIYIRELLAWNISWFHTRANIHRNLYFGIRISIIVISVSLPALVSEAADAPNSAMELVISIASVLVALLAALESFLQPGETWKQFRTTEFELERIRHECLARALKAKDEAASRKLSDECAQRLFDLLTRNAKQHWGLRLSTAAPSKNEE